MVPGAYGENPEADYRQLKAGGFGGGADRRPDSPKLPEPGAGPVGQREAQDPPAEQI